MARDILRYRIATLAAIVIVAGLAFHCIAALAQGQKFPVVPQAFARPVARAPALFKPEGAGPFPAIVLSHSCSGLSGNLYNWAERFTGAGYVVLVIDHLGPRGRKFNCPPNEHNVSVTEFATDAFEALRFLQSQSYVDPQRIAQAGFSYGAMAGLRIASAKFARQHFGEGRHFAAVVAFYPLCNRPGSEDYQRNFYDDISTPLLLLLGREDDETLPASCVEQARKNAARGQPVEWKLYDNATHAFDAANLAGAHVTFQRARYTYRGDAQTTEQAWQEMKAFLDRHLAPAVK
jgi:dienelactone hydrolase